MASPVDPATFGCASNGRETLDDSFDFSSLYGEFRDEARDQLGLLDAALLRIEDEGELPEEDRTALLRALHTLKGNSGMLGRGELADGVHQLETVFKDVPDEWTRGTLDLLFEISAALRRAVELVGADEEGEALERVKAIGRALEESGGRAAPSSGEGDDGLGPRLRGDDEHGGDDEQRGGEEHGGEEGQAPPVIPAEAGTQPVETGDESQESAALDLAGEIVRVPFASLDALLNRVGELVTLETRMEELVSRERHALEAAGLRRQVEDAAEGLARLSTSLHDTTMQLRLVPVRRSFERYRSVVRDLARQEGKQVRVETEGEDVRIDKATADAISEPLLHLVRNAVDHGIRTPAEREAAGKDPVGTVRLRAERAGDRVRISVEDDGKGLDRAGIQARARDLGLIESEETLEENTAMELILQSGFSTRSEVTTVSGRGVGLDVVRRKIIELRGSLSIETPEGGGTRFVLDLPLTIAIIPAVLFEAAGGQMLAFAAADVRGTLKLRAVERAGGAEVVRDGEDLVPVARLERLFGWSEPQGSEGRDDPEAFALVVRSGRRSAAVLASSLVDQRDLVVKAVPTYLGPLPGVSGMAATHEGRVVLLLDASGVLSLNLERHRRGNRGD